MKIGLITFIDKSSPAVKQKALADEVERAITKVFLDKLEFVSLSIEHDRPSLRAALIRLCDGEKCHLVLTAGGTGPSANDFTPDVTLENVDRKLPGFGEIMRYYSYERFKVSVLSRAEAGVRGKSLVINLPAKPKPISFCLKLLQEGICEAVEQISGLIPKLRGDEIEVPIDKYLPFLKKLRPKADPDGDKHPLIR
jgi:molybdopterin adenylyltransferase